MLEILLVVAGLFFGSTEHVKQQQFYRGVDYGCIAGVAYLVHNNHISVTDQQIYDHCDYTYTILWENDFYHDE